MKPSGDSVHIHSPGAWQSCFSPYRVGSLPFQGEGTNNGFWVCSKYSSPDFK